MKTLLLLLLTTICYSQDNQVSLLIGEMSLETSFQIKTEGLNYGLALGIVNSNVAEKRATRNDRPKVHSFTTKVTPFAFGLIGATFDKLTITGKVGTAYVEQKINNVRDNQNLFLAVGINAGYRINNLEILMGYDSVNAVTVGVGIIW